MLIPTRHRTLASAALAGLVATNVAGCSPCRTLEVWDAGESPQLREVGTGEAPALSDLLGRRATIVTSNGQELSGRVVEVTPQSFVIETAADETTVGNGAPTRTTVALAPGDTIRIEGRQAVAKIVTLAVVGTIVYVTVAFVGGVSQMGGS